MGDTRQEPRERPGLGDLWRSRLAPLVLAVLLAAGMSWSWGKWPDPVVDFGRELYTPWRLTEGDVLYRDVAHIQGPLSPYLNALWFRLFGVSLSTLAVVNGVIALGVLLLLYWLVGELAGPGASFLAGLTFLGAFAFSQYVFTGNYNWICPYSHETTHGITLSLVAIAFLSRYLRSGDLLSVGLCGLSLGLVLLTKMEISLAAVGAVACGLGAAAWARGAIAWRDAWVWLLGLALPPLAALACLATALPFPEALTGTLGSWAHGFDPRLRENHFFQTVMGVDAPLERLQEIAVWAAGYLFLLTVLTGVAFLSRRLGLNALGGAAVVGVAVLVLCWTYRRQVPWPSMARPWPVFLLALAVLTLLRGRAVTGAPQLVAGWALRLTAVLFAGLLLARVALRCSLAHYGFALALPATVLLLAAAWSWLPARWPGLGEHAAVLRAGLLAAWLVAVGACLQTTAGYYAAKVHPVGAGRDRFVADVRGAFVATALERLAELAAPGQTLAVLPEGVMLNYLSRRPAPTPYITLMPPEVIMFGEAEILEAFRQQPPDWLLLVHRDTTEYGVPFFGQDYATQLGQWVSARYEAVEQVGARPLAGVGYGILITRHRAGQAFRHGHGFSQRRQAVARSFE